MIRGTSISNPPAAREGVGRGPARSMPEHPVRAQMTIAKQASRPGRARVGLTTAGSLRSRMVDPVYGQAGAPAHGPRPPRNARPIAIQKPLGEPISTFDRDQAGFNIDQHWQGTPGSQSPEAIAWGVGRDASSRTLSTSRPIPS